MSRVRLRVANHAATIAALAFAAVAAATASQARGDTPIAAAGLYGEELSFEIRRNGSRVGEHVVTFDTTGETVSVRARTDIKVGALFVTLYRFAYESRSTWDEAGVVSLHSETDDDGETVRVQAQRSGGDLVIDGPDGRVSAPASILPTDHWYAAVIGSDQVLNTITGRVNDVAIAAAGREEVETGGGPRAATRYVYEGDLDVEAWYDDEGRWVRLRFEGRDGSSIDYVCQRCNGDAGAAPTQ